MCIFWLKAKVNKALELGTACQCAFALFSFGVSRSLSITATTITDHWNIGTRTLLAVQEKRSAIAFDVDDLVEAKALLPLYNLGTGTVAGSPAAAKALEREH